MNMICNNPTAQIMQGNTLADPKFMENSALKHLLCGCQPTLATSVGATDLLRPDPHERF